MIENYDRWLNDSAAYARFTEGPLPEPEYEDDDEARREIGLPQALKLKPKGSVVPEEAPNA